MFNKQTLSTNLTIDNWLSELATKLEEDRKQKFDKNPHAPSDDSIFEENPVDLETFLYHEKYLGLADKLSKPQFELVTVGTDILNKPSKYTEIVAMVGQFGGKDWCSSIITSRALYLLLCLKNPQEYYGLAWNSAIDVVNMAQNALAAREVYFSYLTQFINKAPIYKELGSFKTSGRPALPYTLTLRSIKFNKRNIRAFSGNSEDESLQGYNPILIVLDEIDAFKSKDELPGERKRLGGAEGIYTSSRLLVTSRFPNIGKVILLSWPRYQGSFIMQRHEIGKTENSTYVVCKSDGSPYATWEFNPKRFQSDFAEEYIKDPDNSRARFQCDPQMSESAFLPIPDVVFRAFDTKVVNKTHFEWARNRPIIDEPISENPPKYRHYIHVDLAVTHNRAALAMVHRKEDDIIYVDTLKTWEAQEKREIQFRDIIDYIDKLSKEFAIGKITFDGFQSVAIIQELKSKGLQAEVQSVDRNREAYDTLKELLNTNRLIGFHNKILVKELLGLTLSKGKKIITRSPRDTKDLADACSGAVRLAAKEINIIGTTITVGHIEEIFAPVTTRSDMINIIDIIGKMKDPNTSPEECSICCKRGGLEYDTPNNIKICLICQSKWILDGEDWVLIREPNIEALKDIGVVI